MFNRQFNINGSGKEMLLDTIRLAFLQEGKNCGAYSYIINPRKGLILFWNSTGTCFPVGLSPETVTDIIWEWMKGKTGFDPEQIDAWSSNYNCIEGWRAYCETGGKVGEYSNVIIAVKPTYLWQEKDDDLF